MLSRRQEANSLIKDVKCGNLGFIYNSDHGRILDAEYYSTRDTYGANVGLPQVNVEANGDCRVVGQAPRLDGDGDPKPEKACWWACNEVWSPEQGDRKRLTCMLQHAYAITVVSAYIVR